MADADTGPITKFPADDLRPARRFITSHNKAGLGVFVRDDDGDHHRVMVRGKGVANIIYSTSSNPVDMNNEKDIAYARDIEPGIHVPNGTVARLIDFAPGVESPLHRAISIDYGVVIEGEFEFTFDSGESKIMRAGDMSVNRGTIHKWRNVSPDKNGRMLFVLFDFKPLFVEGKEIREDLEGLASKYAEVQPQR